MKYKTFNNLAKSKHIGIKENNLNEPEAKRKCAAIKDFSINNSLNLFKSK